MPLRPRDLGEAPSLDDTVDLVVDRSSWATAGRARLSALKDFLFPVTAADLDSGAAVAGTVLTANGTGGASYTPPGPLPPLILWTTPMPVATRGPTDLVTPGEGSMYLLPWICHAPATIDRFAVWVQTVGTAGAVIRGGVYTATDPAQRWASPPALSNGLTLVGELGTQDGTVAVTDAAPNESDGSVARAVPAGVNYIAIVVQGEAGTRPAWRRNRYQAANLRHATAGHAMQERNSYIATSVAGALPATVNSGSMNSASATPVIAIRIA
jgi:hypothetical protein